MLAVRAHAENLPLSTPGKDRFKPVAPELPIRRSPPFVLRREQSRHTEMPEVQLQPSSEQVTSLRPIGAEGGLVRQKTPEPCFEVVPRRVEWTPLKDNGIFEPPSSPSPSDEKPGLMDDFGFRATATQQAPAQFHGTGVGIMKRRRIDLIEGSCLPPIRVQASKAPSRSKKPAKEKKTKAAPKKPKTITDLVTSHHRATKATESPMAELLVATQARTRDSGGPHEDDIEVGTRAAKRKAPGQTSQARKRQLLSPTSAMKAFNQLETVFGSASQLIRDRPKVEMDLSSDPVSPARTQITSVGSITPKIGRGSSRYVRTRNLWGAADRDDDNALLHVDSIDLFDTPGARVVLAGKDALLAPGRPLGNGLPRAAPNRDMKLDGLPKSGLLGGTRARSVTDVDDFPSPASDRRSGLAGFQAQSVRTFHTSIHQASAAPVSHSLPDPPNSADANVPELRHTAQPRPNYTGMQTGELQKMIKDYGFKAIRSRQKMVDLLSKCWDEKEARRVLQQANGLPETSQPVPRQGDFISKIHDLSDRPQPKAKKTSTKARAAPKTKTTTKDSAQDIKPRSKAATKTDSAEKPKKPKKPRKRKTKESVAEHQILDVDDIDDDFTVLTTIRETKERQKSQQASQPVTPSEALHTPGEGGAPVTTIDGGAQTIDQRDMPVSSADGEVGQQIYAAVLHQSEQAAEVEQWDHVRAPTWHEKMLMYDPIIIEDLARWLNAEGLDKIQVDREVTTTEVRDWCESKGVCCMWKGGWRGSKGGVA